MTTMLVTVCIEDKNEFSVYYEAATDLASSELDLREIRDDPSVEEFSHMEQEIHGIVCRIMEHFAEELHKIEYIMCVDFHVSPEPVNGHYYLGLVIEYEYWKVPN